MDIPREPCDQSSECIRLTLIAVVHAGAEDEEEEEGVEAGVMRSAHPGELVLAGGVRGAEEAGSISPFRSECRAGKSICILFEPGEEVVDHVCLAAAAAEEEVTCDEEEEEGCA